ncbi:MAG: hypothetical protein HYV59_09630 [Planctomycetes bacterium]|nr:hypothetical protein [Planctomycetota bacterium]
MAKFSKEYLEKTIKVWQLHSLTPLSMEDAREIAENMIGLYSFLLELEQKSSVEERLYGNNWN